LRSFRRQGDESGQALVIFAGGLIAILAVLALVIDTGNVWANQRMVQNGTDAAAEAGAVVMAQRLAGVATPPLGWDSTVNTQVDSLLAANGITRVGAYYTDVCGIPLESDGDPALNGDGTQDLARAAAVGTGIPVSTATTPDCPNRVVGPPAGVLVVGRKDIDTYVARVVGINSFSPTTQATAVSGWLTGQCDGTQGSACSVLPVTIYVYQLACERNGTPILTTTEWEKNKIYKVPLCKNTAGSVGWIDWQGRGGGASEVAASIDNPNNPPIDLPSWWNVTQTGNINSTLVEDALRRRDGQIVSIPMFDYMCNPAPHEPDPISTKPTVETPSLYGCPSTSAFGGGSGSNLWYRFPAFASFMLCKPSIPECGGLHGAYLQDPAGKAVCDAGANEDSCLVGAFVDIIRSGTVTAGSGGGTDGTKTVGTQLIR
jgi:hypothetical protein